MDFIDFVHTLLAILRRGNVFQSPADEHSYVNWEPAWQGLWVANETPRLAGLAPFLAAHNVPFWILQGSRVYVLTPADYFQ